MDASEDDHSIGIGESSAQSDVIQFTVYEPVAIPPATDVDGSIIDSHSSEQLGSDSMLPPPPPIYGEDKISIANLERGKSDAFTENGKLSNTFNKQGASQGRAMTPLPYPSRDQFSVQDDDVLSEPDPKVESPLLPSKVPKTRRRASARSRADSNISNFSSSGAFLRMTSSQNDAATLVNQSKVLQNLFSGKDFNKGNQLSALQQILPSLLDTEIGSSRGRSYTLLGKGRRTSISSGITKSRRTSAIQSEEEVIELMLLILKEASTFGEILIVVEDAQNLDNKSWKLLQHAILQGRDNKKDFNVRFVVAHRPETLRDDIEQLKTVLHPKEFSDTSNQDSLVPDESNDNEIDEENDVVFFNMRPFDLKESLVFVASVLKVCVTEELLMFLHRRSNGNPQALLSLFNELEEQQIIYVNPESLVVSTLINLDQLNGNYVFSLPDHVQAQIHKDFDQLSNNARFVLKLASVVGKLVPLNLLSWLYQCFSGTEWAGANLNGLPSDELIETINFLCDQHIFLEKPEKHTQLLIAAPPFINFEHEEERYLIYGMMLLQHRKKIHEAILTYYEKVNCIAVEPGHLGYHALLSDSLDKAFAYFEQGIKQAILVGHTEDAFDYIQHCHEVVDKLDASQFETDTEIRLRQIKLQMMYGQTFLHEHKWDEACKYFKHVLRMSGYRKPEVKESKSIRLLKRFSLFSMCFGETSVDPPPSGRRFRENSMTSSSNQYSNPEVREISGSIKSYASSMEGDRAVILKEEMLSIGEEACQLMDSILAMQKATQEHINTVKDLNTEMLARMTPVAQKEVVEDSFVRRMSQRVSSFI